MSQFCGKCGASLSMGNQLKSDAKFCGKCGAKIIVPATGSDTQTKTQPATSRLKCPRCGTYITPGKQFCGGCRSFLSFQVGPETGSPGSPTCPKCGIPLIPGRKFCKNCGVSIGGSSAGLPTCPKCGSPVTPGKKFCRSCGGKLEG